MVGLVLLTALAATACGVLGGEAPTYRAMFSRAIQLFPGGDVRVLGVQVGTITDVRNTDEAVEVTFTIDEPGTRLPADVEAVIVPASLLGERYVQLLPAYTGGEELQPGAVIPLSRTAVPAEPDELLASLQDYLGAIDPQAVSAFVENAAAVLEDTGQELNSLIHHGTNVLSTLSAKRDDLAAIIVEFERLTTTLSTRQAAIARLIHSYNAVIGTLTSNRGALEGTITGLNDAAAELASLLLAHEGPLHEDIRSLTRTSRTLSRNVETLAETGHWAERLFRAARRAVDFDADWLRLNNQGEHLPGMIVSRLRQRLMEFCQANGVAECSTPQYWSRNVPSLFCFAERCPTERQKKDQSVEEQLTDAIEGAPPVADQLLERFREISCRDAEDRDRCLEEKSLLIDCARSDHPRRCVREHDLDAKCLDANDVRACLDRARRAGVANAVEGLLEETLDPENVLPGGGRR